MRAQVESYAKSRFDPTNVIAETRKSLVSLRSDNPKFVTKVRKPVFYRNFESESEAVISIKERERERQKLVGLLGTIGAKSPESSVLPSRYNVFQRPDGFFDYEVYQKRVVGQTLDQLGVKVIKEPTSTLANIGQIFQAHLILLRHNAAVDVLGSLWPGYPRHIRLIRPFLPLFFSKNIMIGDVNGKRDSWLVDSELIDLMKSQESVNIARQTLVGAYISILLINARKGLPNSV